ncbi:MAG: signal peptidase I [Methanomicrobiales archaeon]|nr:signal peptidase I [Methanomicrobiales archaeon]
MIRVGQIRGKIAVAIGLAILAAVLLFIWHGAMIMIVLSGSMTPLMLPGDVIVVVPTEPDTVRVGDVIVFQHPDLDDCMVITHRVIDIDPETGHYSTKGDANNAPDQFSVTKEEIIGRPAFLIPLIGFASEMKRQIILLMVILPSLALAILEMRTIIREARTPRRPVRECPVPRGKVFAIRRTRLALLFVTTLGAFLLLTLPSITGMQAGIPDLGDQHLAIEGRGLVPEIYMAGTGGVGGTPAFGVVQPGETVSVPVSRAGSDFTVARAPYIIPVFWFVGLAMLSPYLPVLSLAILPGILLTLLLYPLWTERKFIKSRRKRRLVERVLEN